MNDKDLFLLNERFNNPEFAKRYSARHLKMSVKFANKLAVKLFKRDFKKGKVMDSGCGPGFIIIELAKKFAECEFVGIDLSEPLLKMQRLQIKKKN